MLPWAVISSHLLALASVREGCQVNVDAQSVDCFVFMDSEPVNLTRLFWSAEEPVGPENFWGQAPSTICLEALVCGH